MGNYSIRGLAQMAPENEVATVLSHFNSQFIYNVINDKLMERFKMNFMSQDANIVQAFDQNFKNIRATYPSDEKNIDFVELETYKEIIQLICAFYAIEPPQLDAIESDPNRFCFTTAFYLYDFLVSGFYNHLCDFFARYIYTNRDAIYTSMNLEAFRKGKDSSTLYGKSVFKDIRTAIISANIMMVVNNMTSFDMPIEGILMIIYGNENIVGTINEIVSHYTGADFFKEVYCNIPLESKSMMYTDIRFRLQQISAGDNELETQLF